MITLQILHHGEWTYYAKFFLVRLALLSQQAWEYETGVPARLIGIKKCP